MTETMVRADLQTAPAITPIIGTLLDAVGDIIEGIGWLEAGVGTFESFNCAKTDRRANWPCPVVFMTPPVQDALATGAAGGTVAADTYFVTITALDGAGGETVESNEQTIVTAGATSTITAEWTLVTGAKGYRIYITGGASGTEKFVDEVGAVDTYLWDGTPAISAIDPPGSNTALVTKEFDGPAWPEAVRFVNQAGAICNNFGRGGAEQLAKIKAVFLARESYGVERAVIETVLQGATDITPASGAVSPQEAIGLLEGHASENYAGVPTIHLPRSLGTPLFAEGALIAEGKRYLSKQGSKVASGGGYITSNMSPAGVDPAAGELWVYASGEVMVARGPVVERDTLSQVTNENHDLIERPYVVAVDCYTSAIRVRITE